MSRSVTVWSLELTDPAAIREPSKPPAVPLAIARATTPGTSARFYASVGEEWLWTDRAGWTGAQWTAWEAQVETWVGRADGAEVGYVELRTVDAREHGHVEIAYFGLLPDAIGRGFGGPLLVHGMRRALELAPRVWVHTCSDDGPHALRNYEARGFRIFRTDTVLR